MLLRTETSLPCICAPLPGVRACRARRRWDHQGWRAAPNTSISERPPWPLENQGNRRDPCVPAGWTPRASSDSSAIMPTERAGTVPDRGLMERWKAPTRRCVHPHTMSCVLRTGSSKPRSFPRPRSMARHGCSANEPSGRCWIWGRRCNWLPPRLICC